MDKQIVIDSQYRVLLRNKYEQSTGNFNNRDKSQKYLAKEFRHKRV